MTAILSKTLSVFGIFYSALSLIAMAVIVLDSTGVSLSVLGGAVLPYGIDKWLSLVAMLGILVGLAKLINFK